MVCYADFAIKLMGARLTELERLEAAVDAISAHVTDSARKVEEHLAALVEHKQRAAIAAQKLQEAVDQHKATLLMSADLGGNMGFPADNGMMIRGQ